MDKQADRRVARRVAVIVASLTLLSSLTSSAGAIRNGVVGVEAEAPWAVVLMRRSDSKPFCTGSLVTPNVVLTAMHCTDGFAATELKVRTASGLVSVGVDKDENAEGHDVALLHLADRLAVATVPLAPDMSVVRGFVDKGVTYFGYGDTEVNGSMSDRVRKTPDGSYQGAPYCQRYFGPSGSASCFLKTRTFAEDGVAVLHGDSGGPWVGWVDGAWVQLAIERGGISEISPNSRGPEGGASVGASAVRSFVLRETHGEILDPDPGVIVRNPATAAAWLIDSTGFRRWIRSGRTYECLVARGAQVHNEPAARINTVPDRIGSHAGCNATGSGSACTVDLRDATGPTEISGTPGNDVICGSPYADKISAQGGNDIVFGGGGNDQIAGLDGDDRIYGESGNDDIVSGRGNDVADGGTGTNRCVAEQRWNCVS